MARMDHEESWTEEGASETSRAKVKANRRASAMVGEAFPQQQQEKQQQQRQLHQEKQFRFALSFQFYAGEGDQEQYREEVIDNKMMVDMNANMKRSIIPSSSFSSSSDGSSAKSGSSAIIIPLSSRSELAAL